MGFEEELGGHPSGVPVDHKVAGTQIMAPAPQGHCPIAAAGAQQGGAFGATDPAVTGRVLPIMCGHLRYRTVKGR